MQIQRSCVVQLGGVDYWLRDRVEYTLPHSEGHSDIFPAVAIHTTDEPLTVEFLRAKLQEFAHVDDVFTPSFTSGGLILVQTNTCHKDEPCVDSHVKRYLDDISAKLVYQSHTATANLPEGPYFVVNNCVHQAWRLYEDTLEAFVSATVPASRDDDGFNHLRAAAYTGLHSLVAVPSRLQFPKTPQKPLNGMRLSIKDLFHLKGIQTTIGSKAFTECYGPQERTSVYVQGLIDKGAVIVGKTKMSAFSGSEVPPEKCIDYFPPWNPRADGYQGPSGSSSGAGASIAGYDWLDGSIATDTTGSLRMPASACGLWGVRQTVNSSSWDGAVPTVQMWDTIGVLSRDPKVITAVMKASAETENLTKITKSPTKILYPTDWFPRPDKGQQQMTEQFLAILESHLGIQHTKISLAEQWKDSPPPEAEGKSIEDYLVMAWYWPGYYDPYHNMESFRVDYREKFGKEPYISPAQRDRWTKGQEVTPEQREQAVRELAVFRKWIDTHIFTSSADGSPETIMLLPLGREGAHYRDTLPPPPPTSPTVADLTAYDSVLFASMLGFPQVVVPIGQNPFISRNSGQKCYVPIVGSLTGSPGTELQMLEIAEKALQQAGWPTRVLTGPLTFQIGENERNAADVPANVLETLHASSQRFNTWGARVSQSNL